jgi:hypothetical protein
MSVLHRAPPAELPSGTSPSVSVLVLLVLVPVVELVHSMLSLSASVCTVLLC